MKIVIIFFIFVKYMFEFFFKKSRLLEKFWDYIQIKPSWQTITSPELYAIGDKYMNLSKYHTHIA